MPDYINIPIETDPDTIAQIGFDYMAEVVPGWDPSDGNLDVWILSAIARQAAEVRDVASDVPLAILRYIGFFIFGLNPIDATAATALTNWTMQDNTGYTILDGTNIGIRDNNGDLIPFVTVGDFSVPALSTTAVNIPIAALEPGADGSDLGSVGGNVELVDAIAGPSSITLVAATSGGEDEEDDTVYVSRLITYIRLMSPRPVQEQNFADLAQNIPGIFRAAAIEGLNSLGGINGLTNYVSVFPVDENGLAPMTPAWDAILQAYNDYVVPMMSPNFNVVVDRPDYYNINVNFTGVAYVEYDTTDVMSRGSQAIRDYLDPAIWGSPNFGDVRKFTVSQTIKVNDIVGVLSRVPGMRYVNTVTMSIDPAGLAASDITFPNTGLGCGIPIANTITGTVS